MADIVIIITSIGPYDTGADVLYSGVARCSEMTLNDPSITWFKTIPPNALAATVNSDIKDAAIAAANDAGFTVGVLDKKTLIGGAVGL